MFTIKLSLAYIKLTIKIFNIRKIYMTNYHIQLKKADDVHKYFTWAPEEIEAPWTIKHNEKELDHYKDSLAALEEWRRNYLSIKK